VGDQNQAWQGPTNQAYTNYWGTSCDGQARSWCSEWGIGGRNLGAMPGQGANGNGECYATGWSAGNNWTLTIRYSATRLAACGF
jgi:hypothetical protein